MSFAYLHLSPPRLFYPKHVHPRLCLEEKDHDKNISLIFIPLLLITNEQVKSYTESATFFIFLLFFYDTRFHTLFYSTFGSSKSVTSKLVISERKRHLCIVAVSVSYKIKIVGICFSYKNTTSSEKNKVFTSIPYFLA